VGADLNTLLQDKTIHGLAKDLSDRINEYKSKQKQFALQAILNRQFVDGHQWTVLLPGSSELFEPLQDEGEVRMTQNIVKPIVNLFRAEVLSKNPSWNVSAYSGDEMKIEAANVCEQILRQYYLESERTGVLQRHLDGIIIDGLSYLTVDFYPNAGPVISQHPVTGNPVRAGRIALRTISTLDVLVPDNYDDINKSPCVIECVRLHKEDAQRMFDLASAPSPSTDDEMRYDKQNEIEKHDKDNFVTVYKCHFMPGNGALPDDGKFPDGLVIYWIDSINKVVDIRPFPFPFSKLNGGNMMYPYIDFHMDQRREHYHSQGIPEQIIPLQMELNRTVSQLMEAKNYIGSPIWLAVRGQFQSVDDIPTIAGGVALYNQVQGAPPPQPVAMPSPPSYITEIPKMLEAAANAIHSASQVAQAQQPGSTNSYSGQQLLVDVQTKIWTPFVKRYSGKLSTVGKALLMCEQKYTDYNKQLRVTDPVGDMAMSTFYNNADIAGDIDVTVRIEVDGQSPSMKQQAALQELQIGAITADVYNARIHGEEKQASENMDAMKASRENESFIAGTPVDNRPMVAFENHPVHLKWIVRLIESDDFKSMNDALKQAAYDHAYVHLYAIKQPDQVYQMVVIPEVTKLGMVPAQPMMPQGSPAPVPVAPDRVPTGA